jgi:hypothetical protein
LFQLGDEAAGEVGMIGGARPSLLEVVQRGAGVEQRVSEPAIAAEQCGDVVTGQPGPWRSSRATGRKLWFRIFGDTRVELGVHLTRGRFAGFDGIAAEGDWMDT